MANEYLVNSSDMTAVADAIRTKGGTSDVLEFPGGFINAVGAIEAGGGGIELNISGTTLNGLKPFEINDNTITRIKLEYSSVTRVNCPNVTTIDSMRNNANMEYFNFENANIASVAQNLFNSCKALKEIVAPKTTSCGAQRNFDSCTSLTYVRMDAITSFGWQWNFSNCTALKTVITPSITEGVGAGTFNGCKSLETVVIGNVNSTAVASLSNVSAFTNTPLGGINGVYSGHIYVPSSLIESYKTATNWATLYANYPEIFQPIEGSEYE